MSKDEPYHDPFLEGNKKSSPPTSEVLEETAKAMSEVVGFGKKKRV